ncbi:hypothetical protein ACO0RG_004147 [Hanseniaspora osmophila]
MTTDHNQKGSLKPMQKRVSARLQKKQNNKGLGKNDAVGKIRYKEREEYELDQDVLLKDTVQKYGDSDDDRDEDNHNIDDLDDDLRVDEFLPSSFRLIHNKRNEKQFSNTEFMEEYQQLLSTADFEHLRLTDKKKPTNGGDDGIQDDVAEKNVQDHSETPEFDENEVDDAQIEQKVNELKEFVEQSKLYSQIIAEQLLQKEAKATEETPVREPLDHSSINFQVEEPPVRKRGRGKTLDDFFTRKSRKGTASDKIVLGGEAEQDSQNIEESWSIPIPKLLSPSITLKNYQREGFEWLVSLYSNGLNGILADEMGLGKTLQTLLLLSFIYENDTRGPFLIVTPLSTLDNWMNELAKFVPGMPRLKYYDREIRDHSDKYLRQGMVRSGGCIVTTYEMVIKDIDKFVGLDLKFLVVDEGHRLKNINCKLIQELKRLQSNGNRLLMTGTPLQNNMNELWTLLNFILPDIFTDFETFNKWFDYDQGVSNSVGASSASDSMMGKSTSIKLQKIINDELQKNLISNLHIILKPFLLRRLKRNVLSGVIPPKREYLVNCSLTPHQLDYYKYTLHSLLKEYLFVDGIKEFFICNRDKYGLNKVSNEVLLKYLQYRNATYMEKDFNDGDDDDDDDDDDNTHNTQNNNNNDELHEFFHKLDILLYNKYIVKQIKYKKYGNTIMQLRQIVDSSLLMFNPYHHYRTISGISLEKLLAESGKLKMLHQLLTQLLLPKGHKVLIFSQFYNMLDILEDYLNLLNLDFYRIDGGIKNEERKLQIEEFQLNASGNENTKKMPCSHKSSSQNQVNIFLLSTRAGGLGINLTNADTVILFDSDWNPQVDIQAIDRVHRIGQTKPVLVFRLMCDKTIENLQLLKIMDKRYLEKIIIEFGDFQIFKQDVVGEKGNNNNNNKQQYRIFVFIVSFEN